MYVDCRLVAIDVPFGTPEALNKFRLEAFGQSFIPSGFFCDLSRRCRSGCVANPDIRQTVYLDAYNRMAIGGKAEPVIRHYIVGYSSYRAVRIAQPPDLGKLSV